VGRERGGGGRKRKKGVAAKNGRGSKAEEQKKRREGKRKRNTTDRKRKEGKFACIKKEKKEIRVIWHNTPNLKVVHKKRRLEERTDPCK